MTHPSWQILILSCFCFVSTHVYAVPSDEDVASWTNNILMQTVTVNYKQLQKKEKSDQLRQYFSGQAWTGLDTFFSDITPLIIQYKLKTNPVPAGPAEVVKKGMANGIHYWEVTQTFRFPKVGRTLWMSVIVIENTNPPLLIESLNMKRSGGSL